MAPNGTKLSPILDSIYRRVRARRSSRDAPSFLSEGIREEKRKMSTSLTTLVPEEVYVRQKANSVMPPKGWCDDFSIKNMDYRYSEESHSKKLSNLLDYDKLLRDEKKEFEFRLENIPEPTGKLDDYLILKKLGSGQFGKVYLVQDFMDKKYYAMKAISKAIILRNNLKHDVKAERDYLYAANSPFMVSLIHHFEDSQRVYFVQEYIGNGDVYEHLKEKGPFSEELTKFYAGQVVLALEYLHNCNLVYRDLKPENVMIDSNGYIKLVDFGFVKRVKSKTSSMIGTPAYMAPEMILHKSYDKTIDWWASGILFYEMLAGIQNTPFADPDRMTMYEKITTKEVTFSQKIPNSVVRDLIKRLLKPNPASRLGNGPNGSKDVKSHPWFASIKWNDLYRRTLPSPTKSPNLFKRNSQGPQQLRIAALRQNALGIHPS